uniref:Ribosomal protein L35Ae n=1 Tax=Leersia perrieri TaxID=77586 RepID=A0A0D9WJJ0_9ORYZ
MQSQPSNPTQETFKTLPALGLISSHSPCAVTPLLRRHLHLHPPRRSAAAAAKMVKGRQGQRVRLYVRGTILGYKRSKSNQYENTSLLQIEGVNTKEEVGWYAGKRIAYVYKAKTKSSGTTIRCIWGKVTRPHGNSGVVRAKFRSNLPPTSMGKKVRVMMR